MIGFLTSIAHTHVFPLMLKTGFLDTGHLYLPFVDTAGFNGPIWIIRQSIQAVLISSILAACTLLYFEMMFQVTKKMYISGRLTRYFPLMSDRNATGNFVSLVFAILPPVLWACLLSPVTWHWKFPPMTRLVFLNVLYMCVHDAYFFILHRLVHKHKAAYRFIHIMHHDIEKEMQIHAVAFMEWIEGATHIGLAWMAWVAVFGRDGSIWAAIMPTSFMFWASGFGHSGFKMDKAFLFFHPLAIPMAVIFRHNMLTPGDHQLHHAYHRNNYALFFRYLDRAFGTYQHCEIPAQPFSHWTTALAIRRAKSNALGTAHKLVNCVEDNYPVNSENSGGDSSTLVNEEVLLKMDDMEIPEGTLWGGM